LGNRFLLRTAIPSVLRFDSASDFFEDYQVVNIETCKQQLEAAAKAIAAAVNAMLPVGAEVEVEWGAGFLFGRIVHPAPDSPAHCEEVGVRSLKAGAGVHWKHFSKVRRATRR
jgi:hypothetical protein